jgi:hypothetical protein
MAYPVMCPTCGRGAEFRVYDLQGRVPLWVCPDGHGAVRRAGALPSPRSAPESAPVPSSTPA